MRRIPVHFVKLPCIVWYCVRACVVMQKLVLLKQHSIVGWYCHWCNFVHPLFNLLPLCSHFRRLKCQHVFVSGKWSIFMMTCVHPSTGFNHGKMFKNCPPLKENIFPFSEINYHKSFLPVWNFVYFVSFILRLEWQDEVGMTKNSHSRVILKGMMIERDLTSHPSSRSFEVILTWNDLRMTKYHHSVVIPGWLEMNVCLHKISPDFWAGPWRVKGMTRNDSGMIEWLRNDGKTNGRLKWRRDDKIWPWGGVCVWTEWLWNDGMITEWRNDIGMTSEWWNDIGRRSQWRNDI